MITGPIQEGAPLVSSRHLAPGGKRAQIASLWIWGSWRFGVLTCKYLKQLTSNSNKYFKNVVWETHMRTQTRAHVRARQIWAMNDDLVISAVERGSLESEGKGGRVLSGMLS